MQQTMNEVIESEDSPVLVQSDDSQGGAPAAAVPEQLHSEPAGVGDSEVAA